ncbi:MAG TPA: DivIVA domain-containing protein, partial [Candidatus Methylomirabilis sp.]|nr:DivIVA domain-containing protein [Candidatus Methylomirabilis sp.]
SVDARTFLESLTKLLYASPLVLAVAIVLAGVLLLLLGWRLGRRRADPLLPDMGEPGALGAGEVPLSVPELLTPDMGAVLSTIEVPRAAPEPGQGVPIPPSRWAAPGAPEAPPLFRPSERSARPHAAKDSPPPPEPPRWRMRPEEIRAHTFRRQLRGYDPREVYEYLVAVSDELGALQRRALEFRQESQGLRAELSRWRDQAGTVQNTLATAQKLAEEMIVKAQEEAAQEADRIVRDALERLARLQQEISRLEQDRSRIQEEIRRDALTFAAALRELEADALPLPRAGGSRPPTGGPQEPAGP